MENSLIFRVLNIIGWFGIKVEPICFKLIYMSVVATIIGVAILIVKKLFKNKLSYKNICIIWLLFIISLIVPFKIRTYFSVYNIIPVYFENIEEEQPALKSSFEAQNKLLNKSRYSQEDILKSEKESLIIFSIFALWFIAILYYVLVYMCGNIGLRMKFSKQKITEERIVKILETCKRELNIRKDIILVNNKNLKKPAIFGIFKIRILISDEIIALSDKDIYNVFLHELSHYERKDILYNFTITVLRGIYIFNPAIWLLFEELKKDIELATDEYALYYKSEIEKKEYISTFEKIEKFEKNKFFLRELGVVEKEKILNRRIENIGRINQNIVNRKKQTRFTTIIIAILILFFFTKGKNYKTQEELLALCEELNDYDNLHITREYFFNEVEEKTDYYWKDLGMVCVNGENYEYYDLLSYNRIGVYENQKIVMGKFSDSYSNKFETVTNDLYITNVIYKFLGTETLRGRKTYKVALVGQTSNNKTVLWIDKEKNLILKVEDIFEDTTQTCYYYYEFNTVTDEDVKKPDIKDYPDYEIIREEN